MPSFIVNASTSVVLVDSSILGTGDNAIVYLSSTTTPGQIVSVRDSVGYLSSPQSILVSTTSGIRFTDGTSSIQISQPYASLSFSAQTGTSWNIVNSFGFPLFDTIANVRALTASTLVGQAVNIGGALSTTGVAADSIVVQSTAQVGQSMYTSTLVVGATPPFVTTPGTTAYIVGSASVYAGLFVMSNLSVGGASLFEGAVTAAGPLNVAGAATFGGNVSIVGNVTTTGGGTLNVGSVNIQSTATILGPATFNSNVTILSNLDVAQSTITSNATTSSLTIASGPAGYLQLGSTGPTLRARSDIVAGQTLAAWNAPLYAPYISTGTFTATSTLTAGVLQVTSLISATSVTQVLLSSAQILNPNGNLTISSITANTFTLSNVFAIQTLQTSTIQTSSLVVAGGMTAQTFISSGSIQVSSLNATSVSSGSIFASAIQAPSISLSSIVVADSITGAASFTTMNIPNATINNSAGTLTTSSLQTNTLLTSTLTINSGAIVSPSTITIQASTLTFNNAYFSTLTASTIALSTMTATRITIGAPLPAGSNGPDFYYVTTPSPSTNVLVTGGPGDYLSPFYLSNVVPPGQNPAVPYTTTIAFATDFKSLPPPPGLLIEYTALFLWAGQTGSQLAIDGGPTFFGTAATNQSTTSTLSQSSFRISATLFGSSAINVSFKYRYTPNANSIDSNSVVEFNNGRLYWNYALNGTTIQNSLNDISTRNLFYYGTLNFASDPRIKEKIESADLTRCYTAIRDLPLRRFQYNSAYCSTFHVPQIPRLGLLATELSNVFPNSVHPSDLPVPGLEGPDPLLTIDTAQVEMAHLGATKYLMEEVERLEAILERLDAAKS